MINVEDVKEKIIKFLETNGPSLPVRIAKSIDMTPMFASAIISELLSTKRVITSNIRIGASPLYLLPGQEQKLEEHTDNLKSVEKEAFLKLQKEKVLTDEIQSPAIRVALRNIKDFAAPFKFDEKIIWRYIFTPKEEIEAILSPKKEPGKLIKKEPVKVGITQKKEEIVKKRPEILRITPTKPEPKKEEPKKVENIFEEKQIPVKKPAEQISTKTFLKEVEEFLETQNTKIISIEEVNKKNVIARIESPSQSAMLFAFKKKRINELELMKCYKKAKESNLPYHIIIQGDLTRKMNETIDAYKKLAKVDKLD
ncbi:hypothetical protein HOA55_01770 [archaeon]|jgi:hypothetical protein|nr:hypothetical protein [archaeon]MBT3577673.1 hypothetical protein [archaeon]MBT6820060.1 hypothetical protein [archaeon]MBT6956187.1 hypothetical protein [archaeon]MBT7025338.1 hypothetical protein [archaeon]